MESSPNLRLHSQSGRRFSWEGNRVHLWKKRSKSWVHVSFPLHRLQLLDRRSGPRGPNSCHRWRDLGPEREEETWVQDLGSPLNSRIESCPRALWSGALGYNFNRRVHLGGDRSWTESRSTTLPSGYAFGNSFLSTTGAISSLLGLNARALQE